MTLLDGAGPFRPGPGRLPPYLAGREREQQLFRSRLALLDRGEAPPSEIILYGPRGNGKTSLLAWTEEVAAPSYAVDVIRLIPSNIRSGLKLAERLLPKIWWDAIVPDTIALRGLTWRPGKKDAPVPEADQVLAARASKRALVLLLDEAHTLDPVVGRELLNAAQVVGQASPFLLVLAGTPNLRAHLQTMGASFWNRGHKIRIGRLDEAASADAIRKPLESEDTSISEEALAHIVRESHGYPYFLQLWGTAVWNRVTADPSVTRERITTADTEVCQSVFDSEKSDYYSDRLYELEEAGLLEAARAVAESFADRQRVRREEILAAVCRAPGFGDREKAVAARRTLGHLGFVWQTRGSQDWEPGIPSLMDYIRQEVPAA